MGKQVKLSADQKQAIEEWYRARHALGTRKVIARRLGITARNVDWITTKIKRFGRALDL